MTVLKLIISLQVIVGLLCCFSLMSQDIKVYDIKFYNRINGLEFKLLRENDNCQVGYFYINLYEKKAIFNETTEYNISATYRAAIYLDDEGNSKKLVAYRKKMFCQKGDHFAVEQLNRPCMIKHIVEISDSLKSQLRFSFASRHQQIIDLIAIRKDDDKNVILFQIECVTGKNVRNSLCAPQTKECSSGPYSDDGWRNDFFQECIYKKMLRVFCIFGIKINDDGPCLFHTNFHHCYLDVLEFVFYYVIAYVAPLTIIISVLCHT